MRELNIFQKIVILLLVLLIPIVLLFQYTNQVSTGIIEREIRGSIENRITYFVSQLNNMVNQMSMISSTMIRQSSIRQYQLDYFDGSVLQLDRQQAKSIAEEVILLQTMSVSLSPTINVYSPSLGEYIGSSGNGSFSLLDLQTRLSLDWTEGLETPGTTKFVRHIVEPYSSKNDISKANTVVEISFTSYDMLPMLDEYKINGGNDPFLFRPHFEPLFNRTSDPLITNELISILERAKLPERGSEIMALEGKEYLVAYQKLDELEWYAVDFMPLSKVMTPINKSKWLFYMTASLLLVLTALAAVLLYRNVQIPILKLMRAVHQLKIGDFSARITGKSSKEFGFLFSRFNEMAEQTNILITTVYEEKLRSREATLKQLQSQINPHFLYNCLSFITSMAKLKDTNAVIAMALNLGNYYRFATRVEHQLVPIVKELEVVENYLTIQGMRNQRLNFEIMVADEIKSIMIPRLLIQPIVENAVIHGIEPKPGIVRIRVGGEMLGEQIRIWVEDNGIGMDGDKITKLYETIRQPLSDDIGCGVWNIQQRMIYQFGDKASMNFYTLPEGGLRVELSWPRIPEQSNNTEGDK
jgi:two-component system sensor histidine kinase YesM